MKNIIIFVLFLSVSCSPNPDKVFEESVRKFISGDKKAAIEMESALLKAVSSAEFDFNDTEFSQSLVFARSSSEIKFLYPEKFRIKLKDASAYENFYADANGDYVLLLLDGVIHIYRKNGDFVRDVAVTEKDSSIKIEAAVIHDDSAYYYAAGILYVYSITENSNRIFINEKIGYQPKSANRITMKSAGGRIFIISGIGGAYNVNIVDIAKRNFFMRDIPVSSSKIFVSAAAMRYIEGGSGMWKLMEISIPDKRIKTLADLSDVIDIELFQGCAAIEGKKNISVFDYNKSMNAVPFDYELGGASAGNMILVSREKLWAASPDKLMEKLKYLKQNAPGIYGK